MTRVGRPPLVLDELIGWVRHSKYKKLKEALDELPKGVALEKSDVIELAAPILRAEEQKKREEITL